MIVLADRSRVRVHRRHDGGIHKGGRSRGPAGDDRAPVGHTSASIVASLHVTRLIKTVGLMAAQAMVVFWVGHASAPVIAAMPRVVETFRLMAAQAVVVLRIPYAAAWSPMVFLLFIAISLR